jgi:hypothetical protein
MNKNHRIYKTPEWRGELSPVQVVAELCCMADLYISVCQTAEELEQAKADAPDFERSLVFAPESICPDGMACPWRMLGPGWTFSREFYTDSPIRYI